MTQSELTAISSELIRSMLFESIQNDLESENFKVKVEPLSKPGAKSDVYRIFFEKGNESERERSSLILKIAPSNVERRNQNHSRCYFLREIYVYDKIFPKFLQFEESRGVFTEEGAFCAYPNCYETFEVEPIESLQLEDLISRGFSAVNPQTEELTIDHIHKYLQAIAKFHAVSLALKDQQPQVFHDLTLNLNEIIIKMNDLPREFETKQTEKIANLFSTEKDVKLLDKLEKLFESGALDDYIELESAEPDAVISYGNANPNSIMFRYDDNRKPIEICLLDWQMSRLASPVTDIINFIFTCVTRNVRVAHYDNLLKLYHECLSTHIQRFGSDPEKLFPYELFQNHLHKYAKYGIISAYEVLSSLKSNTGVEVKIDETADETTTCGEKSFPSKNRSSDEFVNRMRDVVVDMEHFGYI